MTPGWQIERLGSHHDVRKFRCGEHTLDHSLRRHALANDRRGLGTTYVATTDGDHGVLGYITLCFSSIRFDLLPGADLPGYPVPTLLIARLAVDRSAQGMGIGRALVIMALKLAVELSERLGIHAVTALNDRARVFYTEGFGFTELLDDPRHLFVTLADLRATLMDTAP